MSIFAQLSEPAARIIWWTINAVLIGLCAWLATTPLRPTRRIIASLAIVLSLPVYQTLIEGQLSILILAGCLAAIALFRRHHPVLASICLSALWLKPQLAVMVLGVLILSRAWKIIAGYLATPTAIFLLLLPFTGLGVHLTYLSFLVGVLASHFNGAGRLTASVWQGSLGLTQGINGFFVSIFGQSNLTIVNALTLAATASLGIPFLWLIFRGIRPGLQNSRQILMLSATGAMILLVDPHLYLQDVVLLFAVLPLLCHKHQFKLIIATVSLTNIALLDSDNHNVYLLITPKTTSQNTVTPPRAGCYCHP
jgi:hypothetical protein